MQIEIKESAIERNAAVKERVDQEGTLISVKSREAAEQLAEELSSAGAEPVGLQQTAPQDSTPADLYLVYQPSRQTHTPLTTDGDRWTFQTTANQYGELGEALFRARGTPALHYFIRNDLDTDDVRLSCKELYWAVQDGNVDQDTLDEIGWEPDVVVFAYWGFSRHQEYWCEVKTGNASFERQQLDGMTRLASIEGVTTLKIRVWIDELPEQYSTRIETMTSG